MTTEHIERYVRPINHGYRFGFPSKTSWCDLVEPLCENDAFAWFHEIERDLDNGRVEVAGLGDCIMLGGYSYLGLNRHPEVRGAVIDALDRFGSGSAGSRWLTGHTTLHRELEERIAEIHGQEDAVTFASGYVTNLATISALVGRGDAVFCDWASHASIIDGCQASGAHFKRFRHNDIDHLRKVLSASDADRKFVVVDGVTSMSGSLCAAPELVEVCEEFSALLMVDECHSHFVVGETGGGLSEHFELAEGAFDLEMGTMGKAMHAAGGYVVGSTDMCNFLRRASRGYIYTRSLSPIDVAAGLAAISIFERERVDLVASLHRKRALFESVLIREGMEIESRPTPIVAVPVGPELAAAKAAASCQRKGVFIHPVLTPVVPQGSSILRASIMANHTDSDLESAAVTIANEVKAALADEEN